MTTEADRSIPFLAIKVILEGAEISGVCSCHLCHIMFKPGDKVQLLVEDVQEDELRLQLCHDDCSMKWFGGRYAGEPKEQFDKRMKEVQQGG